VAACKKINPTIANDAQLRNTLVAKPEFELKLATG
jgi:hypothetical protein